ncbi:hypothetical protein T492DRAFT_884628, partial [Pavlovales sp. CCMP2436]
MELGGEPVLSPVDARERRKLEAELKAFQRMEQLAERKRQGKEKTAARRAADP